MSVPAITTTYDGLRAVPEKLGSARSHTFVRYPHLIDLVRDTDLPTDLPVDQQQARRPERGTTGWAMTASLEQATQLASEGWADGINRVVNLSERLSESISRRLPHYGMDLSEEGGEVDVGTYLGGERACMWTWTDQTNHKPTVRVAVNVSTHAGVEPEGYVTAGVVAAALVDALENTGRRVELDVYETLCRDRYMTFGCGLKRADEPLDLGALAYAVAHPSMLRRTLFAIQERLPKAWRDHFGFYMGGGHGSTSTLPDELRGDITIEIGEAARRGVTGGYDWILEQLRAQGVEVTGTR
jgi:hypothetical protein